jgi:acyl-CoA thioesterase II
MVPAVPYSMEERLALSSPTGDVFVGVDASDQRHLFGGLLIGQAMRAAYLTLRSDRPARSLHASFVLAGNGTRPVTYEVERTRDGQSFSTRRVVARQDRGVVFVATIDFHDAEEGPEYSPPVVHHVPGPDGLELGRYDSPWIESRDVPVEPSPDHDTASPRRAWFKPREPVDGDAAFHQHVLAYLTDHGPTRAVREPHADHPGVERRMSVSLDHSVWFHRPARVDQWLLYELTALSTSMGRGLALGSVRDGQGTLLATVAQEALLRLPG